MFIDEVHSKVDELKKRIESFSEAVKAEDKKKRIKEIERRSVEEPDFWSKRESKYLLKEQSKLKKFLNRYDELLETLENIDVYLELFEEGSEEVKQDIETSVHNLENLVDEFELTLILNDENDSNNAIVTIHSGAGGTEANDWAAMLYRMYSRWIERKNYKQELLDYLPGDEAGIKSVTFNVIGDYSYGYLKGENGIHRLVRQSPFDSNNKRHTSFASVFVLPEIDDDIEVDLNESDLRIDTYRASGAGGQHVNTTDSAVRITHEPTGIVVSCQNERSQHKNKAHAMKILKARLFERELEKKNEERQELEDSKTEMGWGNQIRSYVMHPYKMVKDLRTRHETGNVDAVMDGDIDAFIKSYLLYTAGISDADQN
ncbi:peptide chain release factor 2 [Flexistipes sp.]|uniref:peptide chain release factor 2 n=1 Tax=Flexistipes sp. TaxID=3088135 RepID=UPI002E223510|nr:peptide chain release factor 2 [Flexistipes sp.]